MRKIQIFIKLFLFVFFITSCNNEIKESDFPFEEQNSEVFDNSFKLIKKSSITLPLDDSIGFNNRCIQYSTLGDSNLLSILNILSSSIYFYDYTKKKLAFKVHLSKEGPDGVGKLDPLSAHFVITEDSIAVLNYKQQTLYLVNRRGSVFKKYSLQNGEEPYANPSSINRMVKVLNTILIPCHINGIFDSKSIANSAIRLDLNTGKRDHLLRLPELYNKGAWLAPYKYVPIFAEIRSKTNLLVTYPIDPYLYETDLNGIVVAKHYAGSNLFKRSLPFSSENSLRFVKSVSSEKMRDYVMSSSDFNNLLIINGGEYYLREVVLKPSIEKVHGVSIPKMRNSFIILNKNFEKVGETLLPKDIYATRISFLNENGLHIANFQLYQKDENNLTFDIFKVERK